MGKGGWYPATFFRRGEAEVRVVFHKVPVGAEEEVAARSWDLRSLRKKQEKLMQTEESEERAEKMKKLERKVENAMYDGLYDWLRKPRRVKLEDIRQAATGAFLGAF